MSDLTQIDRDVRPDGTAYGTGGKCRKGTEEQKKEVPKTKKPSGQQSQGISEDWFKKGSFVTSKKALPEPFTVAKKAGTINTLEGPVSHPAGAFIMTGPKGEKYPITPENFRKLKVDNGDGTATPIAIKNSQSCRSFR